MYTENKRLDNAWGDGRRLPQFKCGTFQTMPLNPMFLTPESGKAPIRQRKYQLKETLAL